MNGLEPRAQGGLRVEGLRRSFRGRNVLRDVSLDVASGESLGLVGENGSGKTTLLRCLAGTLAPDGGTIVVAGASPGAGTAAMVPAADRMLNWRLTGRQNLSFFGRLAGFRSRTLTARVEAVGAMVGGSDLLDVRVGEVSTGQRRRLMLATALVLGAPVLLLDEPLADLDDVGIGDVTACIAVWLAAGGTVVSVAPVGSQLPNGLGHEGVLEEGTVVLR